MTELFSRLVRKRGFSERYLRPKYEELANPFLVPEMRQAVERVVRAIEKGEKIIIYGDYDVDGVTASTVMAETLKLAGVEPGKVEIMLPDRFKDGYGMSRRVVERAGTTGAGLVITVDCGSANGEIVRELNEIGVETVVTDHHECPAELPKAVAVVNPKRRDAAQCLLRELERGEREAFFPESRGTAGEGEDVASGLLEANAEKLVNLRDMAGVGVAFTLARALVRLGKIPEGQEKWLLDLVVIGTLCDSMEMTEENRVLTYYGMKVLEKTRRVGLKELIRRAGVKKLGAEAVGFQIGPRLNAAGRMANAEVALRLLRSESKVEAARLAEELETLNTLRREQQKAAVREISGAGVGKEPVVVVKGEWHEGVLGIIAGKLVEEYKRPAFVLSEKDGVLKGSGRSFGDFSLSEALKEMGEQGVIIGGGGHAAAAGVKVETGKFLEFKEGMSEFYMSRGLEVEDQARYLVEEPDLAVRGAGEFSQEFLGELEGLEPFGAGNEVPKFLMPEVLVVEKRLMGSEGKHLSLRVRGEDGKVMKTVAFSAPEGWKEVNEGERVNLVINVEENEWRGLKSIEGRIVNIVS